MGRRFQLSEFASIVEGAFSPCLCATEISDDGKFVSYTISSEERPLLRVTLGQGTTISESTARASIREAQQRIRNSGIKLKPWRFPKPEDASQTPAEPV